MFCTVKLLIVYRITVLAELKLSESALDLCAWIFSHANTNLVFNLNVLSFAFQQNEIVFRISTWMVVEWIFSQYFDCKQKYFAREEFFFQLNDLI